MPSKHPFYYYRCKRETAYGPDACPQKSIRVEKVEPLVWDFISGMLKNTDRLRAGLEEMIEQEHAGLRINPEQERKALTERIAKAESKRSRYQEMAAGGLITLDELRSKLAALDQTDEALRRELAALENREVMLEELESGRNALLERYAAKVPEALDGLTGEERRTLYRMLRLQVVPTPEGYEDTGVLCLTEPTRLGAWKARALRDPNS